MKSYLSILFFHGFVCVCVIFCPKKSLLSLSLIKLIKEISSYIFFQKFYSFKFWFEVSDPLQMANKHIERGSL